jgi:hypothetical protein
VGAKVKDGKYIIDRVPAGTLKVTIEGKGVAAAYASENTTSLMIEGKDGATTVDFNLK